MASTYLISAFMCILIAALKVEGTAKGAVPLDTLTFDKVFLKWFFEIARSSLHIFCVCLESEVLGEMSVAYVLTS